ncbi:MAG: flippase [Candidatus Azambacteria bacterium]|nr:flippase [Candidatus Azambacteria bacterium]
MKIRNFSNLREFLFTNLTVKQTVFKNSLWLSLGLAINKLLMLALLIYVARILGAAEYGKFTFAFAFVSLLVIFHDFGLPAIITREFSKEGQEREDFYSILSLKTLLGATAFFIIFLGSFIITQDIETRKIILILALFSIINGFAAVFYAVFQARQKMEYQVWSEILQFLLISGLGFFILFEFPSINNLSYAYFISSLFAFIFVLFLFHSKIFPLKINWKFSVWRKFLLLSWPLALTGLFGLIYGYIDSVMLGYWNMLEETGWYNAAYKIVMVSLIPMGLLSTSLYPVLSKFFQESKEKLQRAWGYQLNLMILISFPLMAGGMVLAPGIIKLLYPAEFTPSILAFQILIISAGIISLSRPFYDIMIVFNRQVKMFWITVAGAAVNVVLNLFLIPKYSLYGAATATVITQFLILILCFMFTYKFTTIRFFNLDILSVFMISLISSALMYFAIKQPQIYNLNVLFAILIGVITYAIAFFILRKTLNYFKYIYASR